MSINEDGSSTTLGYPTEYLEAVDYASTSVNDFAMTQGEVKEPEVVPEEVPAPAEPTEPTTTPEPQQPEKNYTAIIVVLVAVVIAAAWFVMNKKRK
jgi:hypothetical protein